MADTLPAVPSFRLTPPRFGADLSTGPRFGLSYNPPRIFSDVGNLQLFTEDSFIPSNLDARRIIAAAAVSEAAAPFSGLPLESVGGTTMLRVGHPTRAHFAVGGATMSTMPGPDLGVVGGIALRLSADGTAGIFANVLGAPVVGGFSMGPVFRLSNSEDGR